MNTRFFIKSRTAAALVIIGLVSRGACIAESTSTSNSQGDAQVNVWDDEQWLDSNSPYPDLDSFWSDQNRIDSQASDLIGVADYVYIEYFCNLGTWVSLGPNQTCEMYVTTDSVGDNSSPLYSPGGMDVDIGPGTDAVVESVAYGGSGKCEGYVADVYGVITSGPLSVDISGPQDIGVSDLWCTATYTANVTGGSGQYWYTWTSTCAGGADGGTINNVFNINPQSVGSQTISLDVSDELYGINATCQYTFTTHNRYEDFVHSSPSQFYGLEGLVTSVKNYGSEPATITYNQGWSGTIAARSQIGGNMSISDAGVQAGISSSVETSSSVTCSTQMSVSESVPAGDWLYIYATPFLNETNGSYTEWSCDSPAFYNFILDYQPGVSIRLSVEWR